ncbi:MAG: Gfo/Idh/MocA family oxidoreductase [Thermomicrobiales bacterium]
MDDSRKLRIGVIGCGVGGLHLEGLATNPRVDVVAVAGLDEDRCRMLATKYAIPKVYRDYHDLIVDPEIDAVTVAVPNILHAPVAMDALKAGKHVMVEKPLARTSKEAEEIIQAAKQANRVLGVVFNRRGRQDVQLLKREVERGSLGSIYHARAYWMRRSGIPGLGTWFTSKELAGGGPLIDLGVHVLDMAMWVLGNPTPLRVSAATYAELGPQGRGQWQGGRFKADPGASYDVEDFATAFIRFDGGLTLHLNASWAAYTGHGDDFGLSLMGDRGGAQINAKDYAETGTLRFFGEIDGVPTVTEPQLLKRHGHGEVLTMFIDSVLDGTPMSPSGEEGLSRVRLIEAIYRSAELGREISLETGE